MKRNPIVRYKKIVLGVKRWAFNTLKENFLDRFGVQSCALIQHAVREVKHLESKLAIEEADANELQLLKAEKATGGGTKCNPQLPKSSSNAAGLTNRGHRRLQAGQAKGVFQTILGDG